MTDNLDLDHRVSGEKSVASKGDRSRSKRRHHRISTKHRRWTYYYACRFLAAHGPQPADMVGAVIWKDKKRGKTTSSGGGGDFGAQMLLGRMRKAGLVRHSDRIEGCTLWEVTAAGRKEASQ